MVVVPLRGHRMLHISFLQTSFDHRVLIDDPCRSASIDISVAQRQEHILVSCKSSYRLHNGRGAALPGRFASKQVCL